MRDAGGLQRTVEQQQPRRSLEEILSALDEQARTATDERQYFRNVLGQLITDGPFSAVAVWIVKPEAVECLARGQQSDELSELPRPSLERVVRASSSEIVAGDLNGHAGSKPRIIAGFPLVGAAGIVFDALTRSESGPDATPRRLLEATAELASHYVVRSQFSRLQQEADSSKAVASVLTRVYAGDSLSETALYVAEVLQEELGYDRAWICRAITGGCRVVASSASTDVSRRRQLTRLVERVAESTRRSGRDVFWTAGESTPLREIQSLADEGASRRITVLPLFVEQSRPQPTAVVVLEGFTAETRLDQTTRLADLRPHAALSLWQAQLRNRTGLRGRLSRLTESYRWVKPAAIAGGLAALGLWLAMPTDFDVSVEGRLTPVERRYVFAPSDGVVAAIDVKHDQSVAAGQPLIQLRDPELDVDRERIAGQLEELRSKRNALQVLRARGSRGSDLSPGELSVQEEELSAAVQGAEKQLALIRQQEEQLKVVSPIAGTIDRWDLAEALTARPVVRGQHLLDVLDVAGPWQLDLQIPDKVAGHVLQAHATDAALPITFFLRTEPGAQHQAKLSSLGDRTELDEHNHLIVRAKAPLTAEDSIPRRAGASVIARIHCGRRARAYAWFHEVWEYLQRTWPL
jgi:hypothetical protein